MHQKYVAITNIYVLNIRVPKYIKQTLAELKGEVYSNILIVWYFNSPFSTVNWKIRQKNQQRNSGLEQPYKPNPEHSTQPQ